MIKLSDPLMLSSLAASCESSLPPKRTVANGFEGKEKKIYYFEN